jgi:hypothetical protein
MKKNATVIFLGVFSLLFPSWTAAQEILYEEHFAGGIPALEWHSALFDSLGTPLTPMEVESVAFNPSGDGWVGIVTGDLETVGGLGLAWAGDFSLTNYSMEAEVYVTTNEAWYNAIMVKVDTTGSVTRGYQLAANFNQAMGFESIKFRRYSTMQPEIETLAEWTGSDIPGGPPTEDGWHTMEIRVEDFIFRLFWDRQELPGGPYVDTVLESGPFGVYVFNPMSQSGTMIDDIIVRSTGTGIDDPGEEGMIPKAFVLGQNYPNPFNPTTLIPFTIPPPQGMEESMVRLSIFDLRGRELVRLIDGSLPEGDHCIAWDGRDSRGFQVPSGIYLYNLTRGRESQNRKMTLVK